MVGHKWNRPKTGSQAARKTHSGRIHAFDLVLAGSISADSGSPHKYDVRIEPCFPRGEETRRVKFRFQVWNILRSIPINCFALPGAAMTGSIVQLRCPVGRYSAEYLW